MHRNSEDAETKPSNANKIQQFPEPMDTVLRLFSATTRVPQKRGLHHRVKINHERSLPKTFEIINLAPNDPSN